MSASPIMKTADGALYRLVTPNIAAIAGILKRTFQIPEGGDLALVLSHHAPACNDSALRLWVSEQLVEIASNPVDNLLVALEERLLERLLHAVPDGSFIDVAVPSKFARSTPLPLPFWKLIHHDTVSRQLICEIDSEVVG